jgi:hypothetical protein
MTTQFIYGSYTHDENEVETVHTAEAVYDDRGFGKSTRERLDLTGRIHADSPTQLTAKLVSLSSAYNQEGLNAVLYVNGAKTHHALLNQGSLYGVRVIQPPSFSPGGGTEYTTYRSYTIILEAEYLKTGNNLLKFEESLTLTGTGAERRVWIETLDTPPIRQTTNRFTVVKLIQQGTATGYLSRPTPPPPLYPQSVDYPEAQSMKKSPDNIVGIRQNYTISWTYPMTFGSQVSGEPHSY